MARRSLAPRLRRLPRTAALGFEVPVAIGFRARLLGLARLDRAEAGAGLLLPRCSSVHTLGMRFALDLVFLDADGAPLAVRREVSPRRIVCMGAAVAVLELPAPSGYLPHGSCEEGGEFGRLVP
ncbi:MAG TPA: DUF192 domain-containing protein [Solirubrobacterales bacterium]|nr:DUF192 domain-containing protein [Solirubrobacterales bacterium]